MCALALSSAREAAYAALMACEKQGPGLIRPSAAPQKSGVCPPGCGSGRPALLPGWSRTVCCWIFWIDSFSALPHKNWIHRCGKVCGWDFISFSFWTGCPTGQRSMVRWSWCASMGATKGCGRGLTNAVLRRRPAGGTHAGPRIGRPAGTALSSTATRCLWCSCCQRTGGDVEPLLAIHNTPADMVLSGHHVEDHQQALLEELNQAGQVRRTPSLAGGLSAGKGQR